MRYVRKTLLLFAILMVISIGGKFRMAAQSNNGDADNLVNDGGFEADGEDWIVCGGVQIVDAQVEGADFAHSGRYALRMGQPFTDSCGNDALGPSQIAVEDITIPSDAQDVTVSFWYKAVGDYSAGEVVIGLGEKPTSYLSEPVFFGEVNMDELMPGWQLFRQNFDADQLAAARGKTLYLMFRVRFSSNPDQDWAFYMDDVRAVPYWERTEPSPLPPDLQGDGAQPLLVRGYNNVARDKYGIQRMDTDGGNRVVIAETDQNPQYLSWSPDGTQIAYRTYRPFPITPTSARHFPALVSDTFLMNGDGSNLRKIHETSGVEGLMDNPPGCYASGNCIDSGQNAIDVRVEGIEWSPDSTQLLSTVCIEGRWYNSQKGIQGCSYQLALEAIPQNSVIDLTGQELITVAQNGSWSKNNQLLFVRPANISEPPIAPGLWQADMSQQSPEPTLISTWLTANSNGDPDLRPSPELKPVWAPDGRRYVTMRNAAGNRYVEKVENDVIFSALRVNYTIMLHDAQDPTATRQLVYVDQGTLIAQPTWSPDGRYLLYVVLADNEESADIWWLDVTTGATGQITNDGTSYEVDWLPTHAFNAAEPQPEATPNDLLTQRLFLPSVHSGNSAGPAPQPTTATGFALVLPTVTPTSTPPPLPTPANPTPVPPRGISGYVVNNGVGVGDINVQLEVCTPGFSCTVGQRTTTNSDGQYSFPYAPTSNGVSAYQVTYRNGADGGNPVDPQYLRRWQAPRIFDYDFAQRVSGGMLDIANLPLTFPADGATVSAPVTFLWQDRELQDQDDGAVEYKWVLDSVTDLGLCDQQYSAPETSFTFESIYCTFPNVETNTPIEWYVEITDGGSGSGAGGDTQPWTVIFTE